MGSPCKINAGGTSQIFLVGISGYLVLRNLELTGGQCSSGAAITVSGSGSSTMGAGGKLVAMNVRFFNNTATVINITNTTTWIKHKKSNLGNFCIKYVHNFDRKMGEL